MTSRDQLTVPGRRLYGRHILRNDGRRNLNLSSLLPGTLDSLDRVDKVTGQDQVFYWIPAAVNFPGTDAVYGDDAGNLYAFPATVSSQHSSPIGGLERLWKAVRPAVRKHRKLYFVVVTDGEDKAQEYGARYADGLDLGGKKHITVWSSAI